MKWICQICHIVRSVRESDLWSVRWEAVGVQARPHRFESPICEADRPLTHTGRCNAFSRGSDCIARCAWEADRPHRSDSQICEAVLGLPRPLTTKSCDLSESPCTASHGLTDLRVRSVRPICEAVGVRSDSTVWGNAFSREISQIAPRIGLSAAVRERPIGLYQAKQCV